MDDRVQVKRVRAVDNATGGFRFHVELEIAQDAVQVNVSAQELLDFDRFQTAVLEQTGRLVLAPCGPGAAGPDHYRRHRRAWCDELQSAIWEHAPLDGKPPVPPAASAVP